MVPPPASQQDGARRPAVPADPPPRIDPASEIAALHQALQARERQIAALEQTLASLQRTRSWKITRPLRSVFVFALLRRIRQWPAVVRGWRVRIARHGPRPWRRLVAASELVFPFHPEPPADPHGCDVRAIAFYLPQFHRIPENDQWWGDGFTEWSNVRRGRPQFPGHYQPHVPHPDIGYYDLEDPSVLARQAELARRFGLHGFCFYHYWFSGRRVLERPLERLLASGQPDFPFCLCWANENWTRRWDGAEHEVLLAQHHSPQDDDAFIRDVLRAFKDPRYIRVQGKPLFLIYRPRLLPDPPATFARWRQVCREAGVGELHLVGTFAFGCDDPQPLGLDALVEFPPHGAHYRALPPQAYGVQTGFSGLLHDYRHIRINLLRQTTQAAGRYRAVLPAWDNTARRGAQGIIFLHSQPETYYQWLHHLVALTRQAKQGDERLVFINAWNEWGEGCHLEPDTRHGYAYLNATGAALTDRQPRTAARSPAPPLAVVLHAYYPELVPDVLSRLKQLDVAFKLFVTTPPEKAPAVRTHLQTVDFPWQLETVPNRGRDILPFLQLVPLIERQGFPWVLKLHTKKSTHRYNGEVWREDLYRQLLDPTTVRLALLRFEANRRLGMIGPAGHLLRLSRYWGPQNEPRVRQLAARMGGEAASGGAEAFFAGSMFFVRLAALRPLLALGLKASDFEDDTGQIDNTLAHAVERLFAFSLQASRQSMETTATTDFVPASPIEHEYPFAERTDL